MKLSPANNTNAIRSPLRSITNFDATSLAASKRLGRRSRASIVVDMSSANTMSTPSVETLWLSDALCGRARATISRATACNINGT